MIDKRIIQKYKHLIKGETIILGKKKFYFQGAGPEKIMLSTKISGPSTKHLSIATLWERYSDLNPAIEEQLIVLLKKAGVDL